MESTQFYLQEFLDIFLRRWKIVALFAFLVVVVVTLGTLRQKKIYRAEATVEVGAETPDIAFYKTVVSDMPQNWWTIQTYYETQYKIIKSRNLMDIVAQKLISDRSFPAGEKESLVGWLQAATSVSPLDKSRLVLISVEDTDPERAAKVCNAVADIYSEENLNRKVRGAREAVDMLSKQIDIFRKKKENSDKTLQNFKEQNRIIGFEDKQNMVKDNLLALNESLGKMKSERIMAEARYNALKDIVDKSQESPDKLLGALSGEVVAQLNMEYNSYLRQYDELSTRYKEKHPQMVELKAKMDTLLDSVKREAESELSRLRTEFVLAKAQEDSIVASLDKQKQEALKIDALNLEMETIGLEQSTDMYVFENLNKKLKEADLTGLIKSNNIRVVDRALVDRSPIKPKIFSNVMMALVIGIIGGIGLAYLLESMDNTVKTEEDIKRYSGLTVLGVIPLAGPKNRTDGTNYIDIAPVKEPSSTISEMYKTLRTNISFITKARGYRLIQVTSPGAMDGKTTTAINLAASIAMMGEKTLLVDLDLRKSKISNTLGISRDGGVSEYLIGSITLKESIKPSGIDNLDVITTGTLPPNPAELIGSPKLKEALDILKNDYKQIIIDSSPVAPVADSVVLAQIVDGIIFVVGSEKTGKGILRSAKEQLAKVNANILGVVFNGVNMEKKKYLSKYSSYGYYSYGYSYKSERKAEDPEDDKIINA